MGANESVPQQEQKDPVYKFFEDPMRALGLVYYPGDDDSDDDESDIDRVLDGLYIGGMRGALDEKGLRQKGITHVVNMASYSGYPAAHHAGAFEYLIVGAEDVPGYNIAQHFPETNSFIDNGRRQGAVFVHCFAGMSRAPSAVMAYLMWAQGLSLKEAASTVKAARRQTQPNSGFWKQLEEYHAQQPQGRWGSRQGGQQGGGKGRPIYVSGQRDAW